MDIDIIVDEINDINKKDESMTELEIAKKEIFGIHPMQATTADDVNSSKDNELIKKVTDTYKKAIQEGKKIEFDKRVKARDFRNSIRNGVGNITIDKTLSNKPNKKR